MKISEIDAKLKKLPIEQLIEAISQFKSDERAGVIKLVDKYERKIAQDKKEMEEWLQKSQFDQTFHENKYTLVGIDEVGRGPLAGPVVAAAVILPPDAYLPGLKDSKKLSEEKREKLYMQIQEMAISIGVGMVDAKIIDEINILNATFEAMRTALHYLDCPYDKIIVDGDKVIPHIESNQQAIIAGDDKSMSIAAASVIAKVTRDRMMRQYHKDYPGYDWDSNKGYGSSRHYEGIRSLGITPLHRKSFLKNEGIF